MALCPQCSKILVKPSSCICGWGEIVDGEKPPMPTMVDAENEVIEQLVQFRGTRPDRMPDDNRAAAKWLIWNVLEKCQPEEKPELKSKEVGTKDKPKTKYFWTWKYLTRIKIQSRQFLYLDSESQRYIVAANEDGIPWRGDEMGFFRKVVSEHYKMLEMGVAEYRKQAIRNMRILQDKIAGG